MAASSSKMRRQGRKRRSSSACSSSSTDSDDSSAHSTTPQRIPAYELKERPLMTAAAAGGAAAGGGSEAAACRVSSSGVLVSSSTAIFEAKRRLAAAAAAKRAETVGPRAPAAGVATRTAAGTAAAKRREKKRLRQQQEPEQQLWLRQQQEQQTTPGDVLQMPIQTADGRWVQASAAAAAPSPARSFSNVTAGAGKDGCSRAAATAVAETSAAAGTATAKRRRLTWETAAARDRPTAATRRGIAAGEEERQTGEGEVAAADGRAAEAARRDGRSGPRVSAADAKLQKLAAALSQDTWERVRCCRLLQEKQQLLARTAAAVLAAPEAHIGDLEIIIAVFLQARRSVAACAAGAAHATAAAAASGSMTADEAAAAAVATTAQLKRRQRLLHRQQEQVVLQRQALLSLAAVVKDLLPAYRLLPAAAASGGGEEDSLEAAAAAALQQHQKSKGGKGGQSSRGTALKALRLSQEVAKRTAFERQLLLFHQRCALLIAAELEPLLQLLEAAAHVSRRASSSSRAGDYEDADETVGCCAAAAATALRELLLAAPKFSGNEALLRLCVQVAAAAGRSSSCSSSGDGALPLDTAAADPRDAAREAATVRQTKTMQQELLLRLLGKCAEQCCCCLAELLREDRTLETVLQVVKMIAAAVCSRNSRGKSHSTPAGRSCSGIGGPLLDVALNIRLRDKEMDALRGDERLPAKANKQLKRDLQTSFLHTERKVFKQREAQLLEHLFIVYLRILKDMQRHAPSLVTAALRGLLCYASHINAALLLEILTLLQQTLRELHSGRSSSSKSAAPRTVVAAEEEDEEGSGTAAYLLRHPEVAVAAVATPLLLLQRVNAVLQVDVSWLAAALRNLIKASLPQFAAGALPSASAAASAAGTFLPATASVLQPVEKVSARCDSFLGVLATTESNTSSSSGCRVENTGLLLPQFAARCLQCVDLLLRVPQLWGDSSSSGSVFLQQTQQKAAATPKKGHAALLRKHLLPDYEDEALLLSSGEATATATRLASTPSAACMEAVLLCMRELVRVAALADAAVGTALLEKVVDLLQRLPRLQTAVDLEGTMLNGSHTEAVSLYASLCLLTAHILPSARCRAFEALALSPTASAEVLQRREQLRGSSASSNSSGSSSSGSRSARQLLVSTAEDFSLFAHADEQSLLDSLFLHAPAPSDGVLESSSIRRARRRQQQKQQVQEKLLSHQHQQVKKEELKASAAKDQREPQRKKKRVAQEEKLLLAAAGEAAAGAQSTQEAEQELKDRRKKKKRKRKQKKKGLQQLTAVAVNGVQNSVGQESTSKQHAPVPEASNKAGDAESRLQQQSPQQSEQQPVESACEQRAPTSTMPTQREENFNQLQQQQQQEHEARPQSSLNSPTLLQPDKPETHQQKLDQHTEKVEKLDQNSGEQTQRSVEEPLQTSAVVKCSNMQHEQQSGQTLHVAVESNEQEQQCGQPDLPHVLQSSDDVL